MRKVFSILLLLVSVAVRAQDLPYSHAAPVDSLKQALHTTTNDTLRMVLANRIQSHYFIGNTNLDSALFYAKQLLQLSQKLHYKVDEAYAYDAVGLYMNFLFNAQTLETLFKGIRIAEDPRSEKHILPEKYLRMMLYWVEDFTKLLEKNRWQPELFRTLILASLYNDLGAAYAHTISNQQKSFYYIHKAITIFRHYNDSVDLGIAYHDIANYYASIDQYDSCLHYAQKSQTNLINTSNAVIVSDMALIGTMYYKKGDVLKALTFLRKSLEPNPKYGVNNYWLTYYTLAQYHFEKGSRDSSLFFSKRALEEVKTTNRPEDVQKASALLAKVYKATGKPDSAATYFELALSYNNIINNIDKKRALQSQDFDEQLHQQEVVENQTKIKLYSLLIGLGALLVIALVLLVNIQHRKKTNALLQQKNQQIENTLAELKATQAQLIQSEKMASLGELTAGIAHEIQNPLNFVNNFSEVNIELVTEMKNAVSKGDLEGLCLIIADFKENEQKINLHGRRADSIVKSMLEHSRTSKGEKQPTDLNALVDEYLRLAYHGFRAKDKSFNAAIETNFDSTIGKISIVPQEIGRVLLNLFNNAFYATHEKMKKLSEGYKPTVSVSTKKGTNEIEIEVRDNGMGISKSLQDKIFQPFFTTKPTGEGTGLGLSLSYDIIKAHGGKIKVESKESEGTAFIIKIPIV